MEITPDTSVEKLLELRPKAAAFLQDHGIVCFVCCEPAWTLLRELIEGKGMDSESLFAKLSDFLGLKQFF